MVCTQCFCKRHVLISTTSFIQLSWPNVLRCLWN
jgi:hypothetical protein